MKKSFIILGAILLSVSTFAQLTGGLKAGVNLASQKWEVSGASETYNGTSFHVGGYVNYVVNGAVSIQPELLYNSLKIDLDGDNVTSNYLSVPVMLMYGIMENKINFQAGPQIGILLSTDPSEFKSEDGFTGIDFGLNVGAGGNFGKFNVTARYGLGLSNIAGSALTDAISGISIKNNNFQISVGIKLFGDQ
jgi:hypothetical protein